MSLLRIAPCFVFLTISGCSGCGTSVTDDAGFDAGSSADAGTHDAGAADAGPVDVDAGPVDAGPVDGDQVDAGPGDLGPVDAGPGDMGACVPPPDDPARGNACTTTSECPAGYTCQTSFGTGMHCDITCTSTTAACVCPTGLGCETPSGAATGICS